jgi:hypothetical protein
MIGCLNSTDPMSTIHVAVMAHHTNLMIVKKYFKSLSQINTAPIPTVLSIYIPTKMEPSFIGKK